jgi:hypothetical protein
LYQALFTHHGLSFLRGVTLQRIIQDIGSAFKLLLIVSKGLHYQNSSRLGVNNSQVNKINHMIRGRIFVGKLFLLVMDISLPLPSFILAKQILTSQIMFN